MAELDPNKNTDLPGKPKAEEIRPEDAFEELTADLSDEQKVEFYSALHEAGIKRHDRVLIKFLRALQLYKAYYSTIPQSVQKAAIRIGKLKDDVEKMADRIAGDTGDVHVSLNNIYSSVGEAADKASRRIINNIEKTLAPLSDAVKKALPSQLADLENAAKSFNKAIKTSKRASAEIQKNIKYMQWRHYRAFTLAVFFVILGLWGFIHYWYEQQFNERCAAIAARFEENQTILLELAKSNRRLELAIDDNGSKLLSMKNAEGWNSKDKRGVIEFK